MATPKVQIVISELNAFVEKTMVALALQIIANLVASPSRGGTPVDTGWARANWAPNIGAPLAQTIGSRPKRGGSGIAPANPVGILGYSLGQGPIYITNNVPYIQQLNAGSSKQAPAGFIQTAIARAGKAIAAKRKP